MIPHARPCYRLKDHNGKKIKGSFYEDELSSVKVDETKEYRIDKIIKEKGNKVLVRWLGYGPEHGSWILKKDITDNA